ncbi:MAG TPA: RNA methyltransferase [Thermoleophilaceae bacterium]
MITSGQNEQLKTIRKLHEKKHRERLGMFVAEGEDLVAAAAAAGWEAEILLVAGEDVEPELLDAVSSLGSGTRVVGVYEQKWTSIGGDLSVYLHAVHDPGNVGAVIRSAHALCDGPVVLGPDCADPWSPKAVRASMGSVFARPPARAQFGELPGMTIALERGAGLALAQVEASAPAVICLGAEREGLPPSVSEEASVRAEIPLRPDGPDSLNVAMAATVALYDLSNRMAAHG